LSAGLIDQGKNATRDGKFLFGCHWHFDNIPQHYDMMTTGDRKGEIFRYISNEGANGR
jgi:hypothetical protein